MDPAGCDPHRFRSQSSSCEIQDEQLSLRVETFNAQYPEIVIQRTTEFHDRFLILDGNIGYHIGASVKDAGKKCLGINKIEDEVVINELIKRTAAD